MRTLMDINLPSELDMEVRELVAVGVYESEQAAVVYLVRVGLLHRTRRVAPPPAVPARQDATIPVAPGPGLSPDVLWIA